MSCNQLNYINSISTKWDFKFCLHNVKDLSWIIPRCMILVNHQQGFKTGVLINTALVPSYDVLDNYIAP